MMKTNLHVIEIDPRTDLRWEAYVSAHPDGLIYHHPAWLHVLSEEYGSEPVGLVCVDDEQHVRGVLPLFRTQGLPFGRGGKLAGRRLSSLPRTPVAGPLALDGEACTALLHAAMEKTRDEPDTQLQIKMWSPQLDGLLQGLVGVPWRMAYTLDLPSRPEQLRFGNSRNHSAVKRAINKAARLGVRVRSAETEGELRAWYQLYLDTMRWNFVPPRPYRLFKAMWDILRPCGLMRLLLAEQTDMGRRKMLAGSLYLMFGQTVFYAFNGRSVEALPLRPNDAIHWSAIQQACIEGYRRYDFGEVDDDNQGLARYKSKWGVEPNQLYRYYFPLNKEVKVNTSGVSSHTRQLAKATWRRMPLVATAALGDRIYSFL